MKFFEVFQGGPDRSFMVYEPANPTAAHRFLVVGFPDGSRTPGNTLLTTSKIVDARQVIGGSINRGEENSPAKDSCGNRVYSD